ncbi:MAG TPA: Ig-like domain-containing protein [Polyangia bacterium]|nr:Ig-like domain-containing protein [Polyangia bacterium]
MKRPLRRFEVIYLAAVLGGGGACTPNNSVKPGAPVLIQVSIVQAGSPVTNIPPGEPACTAMAGDPCHTDAATTMCQQAATSVWCQCVANPAPMAPGPSCTDAGAAGATGTTDAGGADAGAAGGMGGAADNGDASPPDGTWSCNPFSTSSSVMFVFDRLLDGEPLVAADGGTTTAGATMTAGATPIVYTTDYASNGSPGELIFGSPYILNDVRSVGPNIFVMPAPALPAASVVTTALVPSMVLAKDGKTEFTDNGQFGGGMVTFATAPFSASITPPSPPPLPADAGACAAPNTTVALDATATITFTSLVDPTALMSAVTVTAGGTAVPFTLTSMDNLNVTVAPMDMWPANSTITITVAAAATDMNGEMLGTPVTQDFMTGAN